MKKLPMILGLILLLPVMGYAFGLRFHPEALQNRMGYENRQFRKINLKSGRTFVGEILNETPESLKITFEGGAMSFSRNEILSIESIDPKTAAYGQYADEVVMLPKKPIFTFRKEDSIFYVPPKKKAVRYIDSNFRESEDGDYAGGYGNKEGEDSSAPNNYLKKMSGIMEFAEMAQRKNDQNRRQQMEAMEEMEYRPAGGGDSAPSSGYSGYELDENGDDGGPQLLGSSGS